jgi:sec-independent protein translocase protein TatA
MFEGIFQPMHLLVILVVALLVFGPKKLPELGKGLGEAISGFKKAIHEGENTASTQETAAAKNLTQKTGS